MASFYPLDIYPAMLSQHGGVGLVSILLQHMDNGFFLVLCVIMEDGRGAACIRAATAKP